MVKVKTKKDAECYEKTREHKEYVADIMEHVAQLIRKRGVTHDNSKLEYPEFEVFSELTPELAKTDYGSKEYQDMLDRLKPALDAHYANNRHHPEHFKNGIKDMTLVDIIEMYVDWYCAGKRQDNGNIRKSIEINKERFGFSKELEQIFLNTIETIELYDKE